jgi:hypothetical protein
MRFVFDGDSGDAGNGGDPDDFDLDRDFPLGDGTADTSAEVVCPYCGEPNTVFVDPGSGEHQSYTEDCQVCCQPWCVSVHYRTDGTAVVSATALDE